MFYGAVIVVVFISAGVSLAVIDVVVKLMLDATQYLICCMMR